MAKKTTFNLENLSALGVERLARLVIDASARDAGFKKYVAATLASANGPEAIAALIDQRLGALERARSFVEWGPCQNICLRPEHDGADHRR